MHPSEYCRSGCASLFAGKGGESMSLTKKIVDAAVRGIPPSGGQRRNIIGQFHGPATAVPSIDQDQVPSFNCLGLIDDEGGLLGSIYAPFMASADDGCEDGMGDF